MEAVETIANPPWTPTNYLTPQQLQVYSGRPDLLLQFAHFPKIPELDR